MKSNNEIIQEYILPNLNEVMLYIDTETHFRKGHDVEVEVIPEEIIKTIESKVKYANKYLVNALFDYQNSYSYFDGRGEAKNLAIFKVFYFFLDYSLAILKKSSFENEYLLSKISKRLKLYGISFILTDLVGKEETINVLSYNWAWRSDAFDRIPIHQLERILKDYEKEPVNASHEMVQLINVIEKEYKQSDVSDSEFLFEILTDAREVAHYRYN